MVFKLWVFLGCAILATRASYARDVSALALDLSQAHYLGSGSTRNQSNNYTQLGLDFNFEANSKATAFKFSPVGQFEFSQTARNEYYFGAPEASLTLKSGSSGFNVEVGRSKRNWSRLDEEFNVGIWQPQLRWDYLAPIQQGLTGIFFDWVHPSAEVTFFTSPVFLPDQGPQFQLRDGQFESSNRWFYKPQSRLRLFQNTDFEDSANISYELDKPSTNEVLFNSSFGAQVKIYPVEPFWIKLAYAYKPMNQFHLGLECDQCVLAALPLEVRTMIHPVVVKHNVITTEAGFDELDSRGFLSVTADIPDPSGMPKEWEESRLHSMLFVGGAVEHYAATVRGVPIWLRYSYMKVVEFKGKRKDGMLGDEVESSVDRYALRDVAAVGGRLLLSQRKSRQISWHARYLYSIPEKGGWLNTGIELRQSSMAWTIAADVLGADVDPSSVNAGLLSRYRSNDRVTAGWSYVF